MFNFTMEFSAVLCYVLVSLYFVFAGVVLAVLLDTSPIRCPDRIVANYTDPNPNDQSSNLLIQSNLRTLD